MSVTGSLAGRVYSSHESFHSDRNRIIGRRNEYLLHSSEQQVDLNKIVLAKQFEIHKQSLEQ